MIVEVNEAAEILVPAVPAKPHDRSHRLVDSLRTLEGRLADP
jgi:hypothetical protein